MKHMKASLIGRMARLRMLKSAGLVLATAGCATSLVLPTAGASATRVPHAAVYNIPQKGINVLFYDKSNLTDADLVTNSAQTMKYVKGLGANYVSIAFPIFTNSVTSNALTTGYGTPTPARLASLVNAARAQGLSVAIRPLLDEKTLRPKWRGLLAPTNPTQWFASYSAVIAPYLTMAQTNKVSMFQIANELQSLNDKPQWKAVLTNAAKTFKGKFQFTSTFWNQGMTTTTPASFGLDAYTGVNVAPNASVPTLVAALTGVFKIYKLPVPITQASLTEVGIMAQSGAYKTPSQVSLFGPPSPQALNPVIQANWFSGYCQIVRTNKMQGIYFWAINFPGHASAAADLIYPARFTPAGVLAIKNCFAGK
jgi:hypothetical protein